MKDIDTSIILTVLIKQLCNDTKYKDIYKQFFSKYKHHYDLKNLDAYDVLDMAYLTLEHKGSLYELADTSAELNEFYKFVVFCDGLIECLGE